MKFKFPMPLAFLFVFVLMAPLQLKAKDLAATDTLKLDQIVDKIKVHAGPPPMPEIILKQWEDEVNAIFSATDEEEQNDSLIKAYSYLVSKIKLKLAQKPPLAGNAPKHLAEMAAYFDFQAEVLSALGAEDDLDPVDDPVDDEDLEDEDEDEDEDIKKKGDDGDSAEDLMDGKGGKGKKTKKSKKAKKDEKSGDPRTLLYPQIKLSFKTDVGESELPPRIIFADVNEGKFFDERDTIPSTLASPSSAFLNLVSFSREIMRVNDQIEKLAAYRPKLNQYESLHPQYKEVSDSVLNMLDGLDKVSSADQMLKIYAGLTSESYQSGDETVEKNLFPVGVDKVKVKDKDGSGAEEINTSTDPFSFYVDKETIDKAKIVDPSDAPTIKKNVLKGLTLSLVDQRMSQASFGVAENVFQHVTDFSNLNCKEDNCPGIAGVQMGSLYLEMAKIKNSVMINSDEGPADAFSQKLNDGKNLCVLEKFYRTCKIESMINKIQKFREEKGFGGCNEETSLQVERERLELVRAQERNKRWLFIMEKKGAGDLLALKNALESVKKEKIKEDEELEEDRQLRLLERISILKQFLKNEGVDKLLALLNDAEDSDEIKHILEDMDISSIRKNEEALQVIKQNYYTLNKIVEEIEEKQIKGLDLENKENKAEFRGGIETMKRREETAARSEARQNRLDRIALEEKELIQLIGKDAGSKDFAAALSQEFKEEKKARNEKVQGMEEAKKLEELRVQAKLSKMGPQGVKSFVKGSYLNDGKFAVDDDEEAEEEPAL